MRVESAVMVMKIRWSRRKEGTDNMTAEQERREHIPETEEEQCLHDAMESKMRDVLSSDGAELNIGRTRPINMQNNREVKMPGPASAMVEAEYNMFMGGVEEGVPEIQGQPLQGGRCTTEEQLDSQLADWNEDFSQEGGWVGSDHPPGRQGKEICGHGPTDLLVYGPIPHCTMEGWVQ